MLATNQTVQTPNGKGIYQHPMYSEGQVIAMVAHDPGAEIDKSKLAAGLYFASGGIWQLCGYPISEVKEA